MFPTFLASCPFLQPCPSPTRQLPSRSRTAIGNRIAFSQAPGTKKGSHASDTNPWRRPMWLWEYGKAKREALTAPHETPHRHHHLSPAEGWMVAGCTFIQRWPGVHADWICLRRTWSLRRDISRIVPKQKVCPGCSRLIHDGDLSAIAGFANVVEPGPPTFPYWVI